MSDDTKQERIARIIYDMLEGPFANQDYARQSIQWTLSLDIAEAVIAAMGESDEGIR